MKVIDWGLPLETLVARLWWVDDKVCWDRYYIILELLKLFLNWLLVSALVKYKSAWEAEDMGEHSESNSKTIILYESVYHKWYTSQLRSEAFCFTCFRTFFVKVVPLALFFFFKNLLVIQFRKIYIFLSFYATGFRYIQNTISSSKIMKIEERGAYFLCRNRIWPKRIIIKAGVYTLVKNKIGHNKINS